MSLSKKIENKPIQQNDDAGELLLELASRTQQEILESASLESKFKLEGSCHILSKYMARKLDSIGFKPIIIEGMILGDNDLFDTVTGSIQNKEQREEHGEIQQTLVPREQHCYENNTHVICQENVQEIGCKRDCHNHAGVEHHWVEVCIKDKLWVVEPFAEMRGKHEYSATAVDVFPADYRYVKWNNRNFSDFIERINTFSGLSIPKGRYPNRIRKLYNS